MSSVPVEECSYWLPLYGSMCCRLAAQPHCMTQQMMSGCLKVKVRTCGFNALFFCDLSLDLCLSVLTVADEGQTSFVVQREKKNCCKT